MKECCNAYLNEQFGGDVDIMNEIYNEYVSSAVEKVKEAKDNLAAAEWIPLDRTAHALKGNALAVGDQEMAESAISLRNAAKLQDVGLAEGLVATMDSLLKTL